MDITKVKRIYATFDHHQANMLLRCNWVLLDVREGRFVLGQVEKFTCPKCGSEIDYYGVKISSWEGLHVINCPCCGSEKIPYGVTIDQYFVDRITEYREGDAAGGFQDYKGSDPPLSSFPADVDRADAEGEADRAG